MKSTTTVFRGTEWLKLETAIEIIGDMISYYSMLDNQPGNSEQMALEYYNKILQLGKERQGCYDSKNNSEIIIKAFTVYGPFLKSIRNDDFPLLLQH
jgi:hypothetical protein